MLHTSTEFYLFLFFPLGLGTSPCSKQQYHFTCLLTAFKPIGYFPILERDVSSLKAVVFSMVSWLVTIYIPAGLLRQYTACSTLGIPNTYI